MPTAVDGLLNTPLQDLTIQGFHVRQHSNGFRHPKILGQFSVRPLHKIGAFCIKKTWLRPLNCLKTVFFTAYSKREVQPICRRAVPCTWALVAPRTVHESRNDQCSGVGESYHGKWQFYGGCSVGDRFKRYSKLSAPAHRAGDCFVSGLDGRRKCFHEPEAMHVPMVRLRKHLMDLD